MLKILRLIPLLFISVVSTGISFGQTSLYNNQSALSLNPQIINLGTVPQRSSKTSTVQITNNSFQVLHIQDIKSDCNCTVSKPSKYILSPGESTPLEVKFDSGTLNGPIVRRIFISSNLGNGIITLNVNVNAYGDWEIKPQPIFINLDESDSLTINTKHPKNYNIIRINASQTWVNVENKDNTLNLSFNSEKAPSGSNKVYLIATTNDPDLERLIIPIDTLKPIQYTVSPNLINLQLKQGEEAKQVITITNWDSNEAPTLIFKEGVIKLLDSNPAEKTFSFELSYIPTKQGTFRSIVEIISGDHRNTIPVFGNIK